MRIAIAKLRADLLPADAAYQYRVARFDAVQGGGDGVSCITVDNYRCCMGR